MHFNSTPKAIGAQLGANTQPDAMPHVSGLHEGLAIICQRIAQTNELLDGVLQRIHGARPVPAQTTGKDPSTPSITELASHIENELSSLERHANEICSFIG